MKIISKLLLLTIIMSAGLKAYALGGDAAPASAQTPEASRALILSPSRGGAATGRDLVRGGSGALTVGGATAHKVMLRGVRKVHGEGLGLARGIVAQQLAQKVFDKLAAREDPVLIPIHDFFQAGLNQMVFQLNSGDDAEFKQNFMEFMLGAYGMLYYPVDEMKQSDLILSDRHAIRPARKREVFGHLQQKLLQLRETHDADPAKFLRDIVSVYASNVCSDRTEAGKVIDMVRSELQDRTTMFYLNMINQMHAYLVNKIHDQHFGEHTGLTELARSLALVMSKQVLTIASGATWGMRGVGTAAAAMDLNTIVPLLIRSGMFIAYSERLDDERGFEIKGDARTVRREKYKQASHRIGNFTTVVKKSVFAMPVARAVPAAAGSDHEHRCCVMMLAYLGGIRQLTANTIRPFTDSLYGDMARRLLNNYREPYKIFRNALGDDGKFTEVEHPKRETKPFIRNAKDTLAALLKQIDTARVLGLTTRHGGPASLAIAPAPAPVTAAPRLALPAPVTVPAMGSAPPVPIAPRPAGPAPATAAPTPPVIVPQPGRAMGGYAPPPAAAPAQPDDLAGAVATADDRPPAAPGSLADRLRQRSAGLRHVEPVADAPKPEEENSLMATVLNAAKKIRAAMDGDSSDDEDAGEWEDEEEGDDW